METRKKNFRLFDCILAVVCVVLTAEAVAPAASIGNSQYFWWIFLLICFCMPYGMISAELGSTYEGEGGICDWVARAYGAKWGSRVAWYYWLNFPIWNASIAILTTENLPALLGFQLSDFAVIAIRLAFVWGIVLLSLFDISNDKWLFNASTILKVAILLILGASGIYVALTKGAATELTLASMLPGADITSLSFISVIIFNFMGFEVVTTFVSDMPNPKRDIPRSILWGGIAITFLYLLSSFSIGVAIPVDEISPSMGILESLQILGTFPAFVFKIIGVALIFVLFINQLSWEFGTSFVARYCAQEIGGLPKVFMLSTKKNDTPLGVPLVNGVVATIVILLAQVIKSERLFWSVFALNLVTFLLSYIPLFPAFLKLRKIDKDIERPYQVPGGTAFRTVFAIVPMVLLIITLCFTIIPLHQDEVADKIPLIIGSLIALIVGEVVINTSRNRKA